MMWETIPEESCEVYECASLITNSFTINSGGRNISERRAESRNRFAQRHLNINPLPINYDDLSVGSPTKSKMSVDEVSFYSGQSPQRSPRPRPPSPLMDVGLLSPEGSPQRFTVVQNTVTMVDKRRSLDEIDGNSMDSGYGTSSFKFLEPQLPKSKNPSPPRKLHDIMLLQQQYHHQQNQLPAAIITPPKNFRIFHSLSSGSMDSMDDDYLELFEMESLDEDSQLPTDLNSLISGDIKSIKTRTPEIKRPLVRRCLSLTDNSTSSCMQRARSTLFEPKTPEILKQVQQNKNTNTTPCLSRGSFERCFKRPEPPGISPIQSKRYKTDTAEEKENNPINMQNIHNSSFYHQSQLKKSESELHIAGSSSLSSSSSLSASPTLHPVPVRPILRKSMSMNDAHIMTALSRSTSDPDLIGDFSKPFCLPLTAGRHQDLKSISSFTLAKLLRGEYNNSVGTYKIIDCRYPYEFEGGHICGAENLYTQEQILEEMCNNKTDSPIVQAAEPKRNIIVFHCEFSSERGPKLSRFLRSHDRLRNTNSYPALHYPEIYLLHGGYKEFFEHYSELCDPIAYRPMLDPSFGAAYKQFRAKSKSWNGDIKSTSKYNHKLFEDYHNNKVNSSSTSLLPSSSSSSNTTLLSSNNFDITTTTVNNNNNNNDNIRKHRKPLKLFI